MKAKTKEKEMQVLGLITRILIISIQILEQGPRTQKGSYVIKERCSGPQPGTLSSYKQWGEGSPENKRLIESHFLVLNNFAFTDEEESKIFVGGCQLYLIRILKLISS